MYDIKLKNPKVFDVLCDALQEYADITRDNIKSCRSVLRDFRSDLKKCKDKEQKEMFSNEIVKYKGYLAGYKDELDVIENINLILTYKKERCKK